MSKLFRILMSGIVCLLVYFACGCALYVMKDYTIYVEDAASGDAASRVHVHVSPMRLLFFSPPESGTNTDELGIAHVEIPTGVRTVVYVNAQQFTVPENREQFGELLTDPGGQFRAWYSRGHQEYEDIDQTVESARQNTARGIGWISRISRDSHQFSDDDRTHNVVNELTARDTDDNGTDNHTLSYNKRGT